MGEKNQRRIGQYSRKDPKYAEGEEEGKINSKVRIIFNHHLVKHLASNNQHKGKLVATVNDGSAFLVATISKSDGKFDVQFESLWNLPLPSDVKRCIVCMPYEDLNCAESDADGDVPMRASEEKVNSSKGPCENCGSTTVSRSIICSQCTSSHLHVSCLSDAVRNEGKKDKTNFKWVCNVCGGNNIYAKKKKEKEKVIMD